MFDIFEDAFPGMSPGDARIVSMPGHEFLVTATRHTGFHTGRTCYRVFCTSCDETVHDGTTGPEHMIDFHVRDGL